MVKNPSAIPETQFNPWAGKIPWRKEWLPTSVFMGFPGGSDSKESACNVEDLGLIPGLGRSLEEGNGNPIQYSCLDNPVDRRSWHAAVHRVAKSQTRLSNLAPRQTFQFGFHPVICHDSWILELILNINFILLSKSLTFILYINDHRTMRSRLSLTWI